MVYRKYIIFIVIITVISGCLGFAYKKKIFDKYYLIAVDTAAQMSVCRKDDDRYGYCYRITHNVEEAGYYKKFIYARKKDGSFYYLQYCKFLEAK